MDNNFKAYNEAANILKALAHPVRLCIVKGLLDAGSCNVTYMQDCLELPQSTVSQHLQKLRSLGIVETDRNGLEVIYSVSNKKVKDIIRFLF
ncbi:MAG: metalloregulator ArsR/SmtB family transcription factor [Paenibacillaceae bacterium]